jgi:hypothetical protein
VTCDGRLLQKVVSYLSTKLQGVISKTAIILTSAAEGNPNTTLEELIIIISDLSDDRSTASSKTIPPLNAI